MRREEAPQKNKIERRNDTQAPLEHLLPLKAVFDIVCHLGIFHRHRVHAVDDVKARHQPQNDGGALVQQVSIVPRGQTPGRRVVGHDRKSTDALHLAGVFDQRRRVADFGSVRLARIRSEVFLCVVVSKLLLEIRQGYRRTTTQTIRGIGTHDPISMRSPSLGTEGSSLPGLRGATHGSNATVLDVSILPTIIRLHMNHVWHSILKFRCHDPVQRRVRVWKRTTTLCK